MKKFLAMILALLCVLSLVSCGETPSGDDENKDGDDVVVAQSGIKLTDRFSFTAKNSNSKIKKNGEFKTISQIDSKYLSKDGAVTYVDYKAPVFEIGGALHPDDNGGKLSRFDASKISTLSKDLIDKDRASDYASYTSGVTIRFSTNATEIKLSSVKFVSGIVKDADYSEFTTQYGTQLVNVYVGSGTERAFVKGDGEDKYQLGAGYKEVLIYLPTAAAVDSFKIGFTSSTAEVSLPLERAHLPVVFYGGDITNGLLSQRVGIAYSNLVARMLNADCINQGYAGGVHGDKAMAQYIAGLEMSAFVMELDGNATLKDLKNNHYTFYKTVRDANPDIPIVILSAPTFTPAGAEAAKERLAVIKETYKKAVESGDKLVYFINGSEFFGNDDIVDLCTADNKNLNDVGMYYLSMAVYDVLNSAFTDDSKKTGVERAPGLNDFIEFSADAGEAAVDSGNFTKISDVDSKYTAKVGDVTYLKYNTPYLTIGGIKHPDQNGGEFCRINVSERNQFVKDCVEGASFAKNSLTSHTSGVTMRFRTNADEIILKANMIDNVGYNSGIFVHMTGRGTRGFDVYVGTGSEKIYCGEAGQAMSAAGSLTETIKLPGGYVEVMIEFPVYAGVTSVEIGFKDSSAEIAAPLDRADEPICFYGSSITQGACASRPGLAYHNIVARMLDVDCINEGYSNSAHGEQIMAKYIATLDMSAFIMDYDHNAFSADELNKMHYNFYKTIRDAHPDIPIIMLTMPIFTRNPEAWQVERATAIENTYKKAVAAGDKNVYVIKGDEFFPFDGLADICTVDGTHPSDIGMYYMAKAVYEQLAKIDK